MPIITFKNIVTQAHSPSQQKTAVSISVSYVLWYGTESQVVVNLFHDLFVNMAESVLPYQGNFFLVVLFTTGSNVFNS